MKEETDQERAAREAKIAATLDGMSKEEIIQILKEAIKHSEELENSTKLLATHLKVLCFNNGGTLTYTKEEFDAASKEDPSFSIEYEIQDKKEVCLLKLIPKEKTDDVTKS